MKSSHAVARVAPRGARVNILDQVARDTADSRWVNGHVALDPPVRLCGAPEPARPPLGRLEPLWRYRGPPEGVGAGAVDDIRENAHQLHAHDIGQRHVVLLPDAVARDNLERHGSLGAPLR
eukprot:5148175-Prymnesium_polylepis.2